MVNRKADWIGEVMDVNGAGSVKVSGGLTADQADLLVMAEYQGEADSVTLVMADAFRSDYLREFPVGTNRFMRDGDNGEWWTLFDADMEEGV